MDISNKVTSVARVKYVNVGGVAFHLHTQTILNACCVVHALTSPLSHPIPPKGSALTWTPAAFISNFLPSGSSFIQSQS